MSGRRLVVRPGGNMKAIFLLHLLYGLTFYTLGVAILSRDLRLSELGIARIIWLLAAFGIIHGCHEWLELMEILFPQHAGSGFPIIRLAVVGLSFLCLLYFGLFLNIIRVFGDKSLRSTRPSIKAGAALAVLVLLVIAARLDFGRGDYATRLLIALPGGRADVLSRSHYENGAWTLEVMRSLKTEGENAETQDVQFTDMSKGYPFGIAVFDNSQINHLYHEGVFTLNFK